jgi:alanyl aminopeptidase
LDLTNPFDKFASFGNKGDMVNTIRKALFIATAVSAAAFLAACGQEDETSAPVETVEVVLDENGVPVARLGVAVRPEHYALWLKIDPAEDRFSGTVQITVSLEAPLSRIWLHGNNLEVGVASLETADGELIEASYEQVHATGVARLDLATEAPAGKAVLRFEYSAPFDRSLNGLFRIDKDGFSYALTQLQSIAARKTFPGFDEPAFKVPFDISVTARSEHVVVTNTPEVSAETLDDGWTRHDFMTTRPLPTYLLAFAVGPYDVVEGETLPPSDLRGSPLPLRGLSAAGKGKKLAYALNHTAGLTRILEDYFQIPFPYRKLDSIAGPDFIGAMENAGAIISAETLLALGENASLAQRRASVRVHAHEISHQWFGDLVTPVWWDDIWLNESFATWMGDKTSDAYWPAGGFARFTLRRALGAMTADSLASARQIRQPIERNEDINSAFDSITYRKGGGVLAMFESFLGEEAFRKGVQTHLKRFADGVATADDFMQSLADGSGRPDVVPAFRSFIDQPGVPLIIVSLDCRVPDAPVLHVHQDRYRPLGSPIEGNSQWQIPLGVAYHADGERKVTRKLISAAEEIVALDAQSCPSNLMPNANGAGYYRFALDEAGWADLAANALSMSATEALAYADSLDAAFRAGTASAETLIEGLRPLIMHPAWDVAGVPTEILEHLTDDLLEGADLASAHVAMSTMFRPRYDALASVEGEQFVLLRTQLARFLAIVSLEPQIRAEMAEQAAIRIGFGGPADPTIISEDLLETVLSVGVQEHGEPFFLALLEQVKASRDQAFRLWSLRALARVENPALAGVLRAEFMARSFSMNESIGILFRQLARKATQDATWDWIRGNFEAVLGTMPGGLGGRRFVGNLGQYLCSAEKAQEYKELVEAYADNLPGYERGMAQALESISLCMTLKEAKGVELAAAFGN